MGTASEITVLQVLELHMAKIKSEGSGIILLDMIQSESVANRNIISPFIRTYYPLSKNKRLSFFNEIKMDFGFENTDIKRI